MMLDFTPTCRWLYVCLSLTLVGFIAADCPFPKEDRENLSYLYKSPNDTRLKIAPEEYILRFVCFPGYYMDGPSGISCQGGNWTSFVPFCFKMKCQKPPTIKRGAFKLSSNDVFIGSIAIYECNEREYELKNDSQSSLNCAYDEVGNQAIWEGELPECKEKIMCPDPGKSEEGDRNGTCCYSDDVLRFSCNDGYELDGSQYIKCLKTGSWDSRRPLCKPTEEIVCERPPVIPHGLVTGDKEGDYFRPDEEAEVLCEPGYFFNGSAKYILCEENGVWEKEFGECEAILCDPPEPLENGTIPEVSATNLTAFPYNFEITYGCDEGYRLVGGDSWRFCGKKGWSGETPHCEEIFCPDPGTPEHGSREGHSFKFGEKVIFSCFSGFYLLGSFERYCMPNGQWSGELARCDTETNYCPDPGIPIDGFKNSSYYDMGARVGFRCRSGYMLVGSEVRECLDDRTWSGKEASCVGQYYYDSSSHVRDFLKIIVSKYAKEQKKEINSCRYYYHCNPKRYMMYFLFDVSGSVGRNNFKKSIEFAKAVVAKVGITENGARAGAITFGSMAHVQILPIDYEYTNDVLKAFDKIPYIGGGQAQYSALSLVREELMPLAGYYFGRENLKTVIFLLTDGKANFGGDPIFEAEYLKEAGAEIYSIGVTGNVRIKSLYQIASDPIEEHVFILDSYATLSWLTREIKNGTMNYSECGMYTKNVVLQNPRARHTGGINSARPWPWMTALYLLPPGNVNTEEARFKCGGSIIHEHFILTAAHCLYDEQTLELKRRTEVLVKISLGNVGENGTFQQLEVQNIIVHPEYISGQHDYDIALLELKVPINFNARVRPVCLPPAELSDNSRLYKYQEAGLATEWAYDGEHIKHVNLRIKSKMMCKQSLEQNGLDAELLTDRMFCAGIHQEETGSCGGNTGGPFVQSQMNSEGYIYWTQVGIVSWDIGCREVNKYVIYTHVQQFKFWIESNIQNALRKEETEETSISKDQNLVKL